MWFDSIAKTSLSKMIEVILNDRLGKKVRVKCKSETNLSETEMTLCDAVRMTQWEIWRSLWQPRRAPGPRRSAYRNGTLRSQEAFKCSCQVHDLQRPCDVGRLRDSWWHGTGVVLQLRWRSLFTFPFLFEWRELLRNGFDMSGAEFLIGVAKEFH